MDRPTSPRRRTGARGLDFVPSRPLIEPLESRLLLAAELLASVAPSNGASHVPLGTTLTITFDQDMDPATIKSQTIRLRDPLDNDVTARVLYDPTTRTATLDPDAELLARADYYTAFVVGGAAGAKGAAGVAMSADYSWSFTTGTPSFQQETVLAGLDDPTVVRFSPDGRVFVAEKSGLIKVFNGPGDNTPTVFADLRTNVHNFWDRGLLGMALHPDFPATPYVYVLYTHDAAIGGAAPRWGKPNVTSDPCPSPPGATGDGCVVSGRLSRLTASGDVMSGTEEVLVEDWGQQYPSHSVGSIEFGPDGALYASAGDGASFTFIDYGQEGSPTNPLGDPGAAIGGRMRPPNAEGGALRSQDLRTPNDPTTLDGSVIRIDPETGTALPDNPLYFTGNDANAKRIIAHGLRNPFRFALRPGTGEIWIGDVGMNEWEEIDRILFPTDSRVENFGWPAYEGPARHPGYDNANLTLIENLYAAGAAAHTQPYFAYRHSEKVVAGSGEPTGSSAISGLAFYAHGAFPAAYDGALFFADYNRDRVWVMFAGVDGNPDPATRAVFFGEVANPVNLIVGPDGALYYPDFDGGTVRRISYAPQNRAPAAVVTASATSGPAPLAVTFSAASSSDPDLGDTLTYAWDLDGDGDFDDATGPAATLTYAAAGNHAATVRVTDGHGASATATVAVSVDNGAPAAVIDAPLPTMAWSVGDTITFAGRATDPEQGLLPDSSLAWDIVMHHCPSNCHTHTIQSFAGVSVGSFVAPDHEYPSHLELRLIATDAQGLMNTASVMLYPRTVEVTLASSPPGMLVSFNQFTGTTPFSRTVIAGSLNSVGVERVQPLGGTTHYFAGWSDHGAAAHDVVLANSTTLSATFALTPPGPRSSFRPPVRRDSGVSTAPASSIVIERADQDRGRPSIRTLALLGEPFEELLLHRLRRRLGGAPRA